jgi:hypothetical protein
MSFAHISWYALSDEEYQQALKERLAGRSTNNNNQNP